MTEESAVSLRSMASGVFLPAMVYEVGSGAIAPVIALTAIELGASVDSAGFAVALMGIGQVIGDGPSSVVASRLGDRRAMMLASLLAVAALVLCMVSRNLIALYFGLLVLGVCSAVYYLARQSYLSDLVPLNLRARASSTLAGAHRMGLFAGPFCGVIAIHFFGLRGAFLVAIGASISAALLLAIVRDPAIGQVDSSRRESPNLVTTLVKHKGVFSSLGFTILAIAAVRGARQTVLPLWGFHLGLSAEQTSVIFGLSNAVEVAMFYPSGVAMDRFGRLAVCVPAMVTVGGAMAVLPLAHGIFSIGIVAAVMGLGNGIGSGIMLTLGADVSPRRGRVKFLAIWRIMNDSGSAAGPLVVSLVSGIATLPIGIVTVGAIGLVSNIGLFRWVPRYSEFATPAMARRQRSVVYIAAAGDDNQIPPLRATENEEEQGHKGVSP